ncbi:MAG TPA: DUF2757 family protein [Firmicutes bacterium]|nr:DUF2757 family protein [Bacillota bacterium]
MYIFWVCRRCHREQMRLAAHAKDPRITALTAQAGGDIIEHDREGNLLVRLLCDDCFHAVYGNGESGGDFERPTQLH